MENSNQVLITVEELCEVLMIGKNAAYQLLNSGKIKSSDRTRMEDSSRKFEQFYQATNNRQ